MRREYGFIVGNRSQGDSRRAERILDRRAADGKKQQALRSAVPFGFAEGPAPVGMTNSLVEIYTPFTFP
jgi:hypothetical protein